MSKPLELTVYPPIPECPPYSDLSYARQDWNDDRSIESGMIATKRLTDAELAAEYWAARASFERSGFAELASGDEWDDKTWDLLAVPVNALARFATLPHYDEAAA